MIRPSRQAWEYKFISANLNAANMTSTFTKLGDDGWEYCDRIDNGNPVPQFLFKRPKIVPAAGMPGGVGMGSGAPAGSDRDRGSVVPVEPAPIRPIHVFALRHADATRLAAVLEKVFQGSAKITPDSSSNSLIVRTTKSTLIELKALVSELDNERTLNELSSGKSGRP